MAVSPSLFCVCVVMGVRCESGAHCIFKVFKFLEVLKVKKSLNAIDVNIAVHYGIDC
jgi:hypothetical protein